MGIDDCAKKSSSPRLTCSVGHARVVSENSTDSGEEGVGLMAQALNELPGRFARYPGDASRTLCDLTVECERGFQSYERKAGSNPLREVFVRRFGLLRESFQDVHFDAGAF